MSELVFAAFQALGRGPTRREVELVAKALRESGDEEALALFQPPGGEYFDHEACAAVSEIASGPALAGLSRWISTQRSFGPAGRRSR